jgi:hypothetical protein
MRDASNTQHLIEESVRLLATGKDEIKNRLLTAYTQRFQYVFPEDVPEPLRRQVAAVRQRLNKEPIYAGQSTVEAALFRMHRSTAAAIAEEVLEIYIALNRAGN